MVMSGVVSPPIWVIIIVTLLISTLITTEGTVMGPGFLRSLSITTHEPPSSQSLDLGRHGLTIGMNTDHKGILITEEI